MQKQLSFKYVIGVYRFSCPCIYQKYFLKVKSNFGSNFVLICLLSLRILKLDFYLILKGNKKSLLYMLPNFPICLFAFHLNFINCINPFTTLLHKLPPGILKARNLSASIISTMNHVDPILVFEKSSGHYSYIYYAAICDVICYYPVQI